MSGTEIGDDSNRPDQTIVPRDRMAPPIQIEFGRRAMACQFQVIVNRDHPSSTPERAVQALDVISHYEQLLSIYIEASDLSRLNREGALRPIAIDPLVHDLLAQAKGFSQITNGAYDITSATLSLAWGFSRREGRMPSRQEIEQALSQCGSDQISLSLDPCQASFLRSGIQVNPGGIGKGYALDAAAKVLLEGGVRDFLIHGGKSSALAFGNQDGNPQPGWRVAVRHPYQNDVLLGELRLHDQALGTSGAANQFFYYQGKRYGHIIDPRTGWPAQNWLSVTVVSATAIAADALATAAFVMSREEIEAFASQHPEHGIIAIAKGERAGDTMVTAWNLDLPTWESFTDERQ